MLRPRYILCCTNRRPDEDPRGSCAARGSEALVDALKSQLQAAHLQTEVRPLRCSCLDSCKLGPVLVIEPDHVEWTRVTPEALPDLVSALASGQPILPRNG